MLQGVIFDFDGTLFDSMYLWRNLGQTYLAEKGITTDEDLWQQLKPLGLFQSAQFFKERYHIPLSADEIVDEINATVDRAYAETIQPKPGIPETIRFLHEHGVKMCVATLSEVYQIDGALTRCGLREYFTDVLSCAGRRINKTEPLIFREALAVLGTDKAATLVAEDSPTALRTAGRDGFLTLGVYDEHEERQGELRAAADFYLNSFTEWDTVWSALGGEGAP
ncbi:MAG: HAD family phosphatase [Clostridia bacterium]|nr:HAD family phosphatase [Clostridia bacterium]